MGIAGVGERVKLGFVVRALALNYVKLSTGIMTDYQQLFFLFRYLQGV